MWGVLGRVLSHPRLPALWAGCRGPLPTGCGCGGVRAWGPVTNPTARALAKWLCELWGWHVGARGGRLLPGCGASGVGRSPTPDCPPSGRAAGAHYPLAVGAGGCGRGYPSPTPRRALLRAGFARCGGGMRVPGGGASCLGVGRPGSGTLPPPTACPLGGLPGPTTHWLWVRGAAGVGTHHEPHSARSCELALRAERAARGCPGGAPPAWVWGVRDRALPHPRLPALWAGCRGPLPTGFGCGGVRAWGPVTNPTARAFASWLCALWGRHEGARGGRLLPGCGASGVGRSPTPDCPPSGRAAGAHYPLAVGAGGCGRGDPSRTPQHALLRAVGAACGCPAGAPPAWVWGVRGRALSHPRRPALWADCRTCVRVRALLGRVGRAGLPGAFWCASPFLWPFLLRSLLVRPPPGWGCPVCGCCWVFSSYFVSFPLLALVAHPLCPALPVFRPRVPWALASCPPLCVPRCLLLCVFSGLGCPGPWRLVAPYPPPRVLFFLSCFFFLAPSPPAPPPPRCLWRFLLPGCLGPLRPPPFFLFFVLLLFFLLRVCCVCSGMSCRVFPVLPVRCAVRVVRAVSGAWCCWFLVSLPFVGGLLVALVARGCRLVVCVVSGARVRSGGRWASSLWCPVPLCCVLWRCAAVWCCAVVPCLLFLFFSLLVALVSCCSPLVLGSGPVPGRCCFCALPVRCCAGVPAPLLSVRCSLALVGLAGVLCCCLLCLCVCCRAWLSSVVSWWLLVSCLGGVLWCVPGCRAAPCCCALCRLALRCCALCGFILFRLVLPRAVLCPGALSAVLGSCAFWRRVLSCTPALCVFCCGVSPRGVVRHCALCRVRPGVSCCVFPVVSALCGVAVWPALPRCPAPLSCAPWCCTAAWCCGVLPWSLVGFVSCVGVVVPT